MGKDWGEYGDSYCVLFADCIPVRGACRSALYDLTRHEITIMPNKYFSLVESINGKRIGDIFANLGNPSASQEIQKLLDFLDANEFIMLVDDPSRFPPIREAWDYPGVIQNAIIDIKKLWHPFNKIFDELSMLGCQHVEVRCFSDALTLQRCQLVLEMARNRSIVGIELILKYEMDSSGERYVQFIKQNPMLTALTVHSAPFDTCLNADSTAPVLYDGAPYREVRFTRQLIDSEHHCGLITRRQLTPPAVVPFFEAKQFNGCLNRKIAIDGDGNIKNCPSMSDSYGNIKSSSLLDAAQAAGLRAKWTIAKDQIAVCSDCEFRYACSDCRAYLDNPSDLSSKPLKCGYDPYSGEWHEWSKSSVRMEIARAYGIDSVVDKSNMPLVP